MKNNLTTKLFIFATFFLLPLLVSAQPTPDLSYVNILFREIGEFLRILVGIIFGLALIFFLWGMAMFIFHAGDEERRSEGKKKMIWGIIVLTVMVSIWGIVEFLQIAFFGDTYDPPLP